MLKFVNFIEFLTIIYWIWSIFVNKSIDCFDFEKVWFSFVRTTKESIIDNFSQEIRLWIKQNFTKFSLHFWQKSTKKQYLFRNFRRLLNFTLKQTKGNYSFQTVWICLKKIKFYGRWWQPNELWLNDLNARCVSLIIFNS